MPAYTPAMADRAEQCFDVFFEGECLAGHAPDAVRAALGKLFKADEATLERLFSGVRQPIKRGCDKATALNYQRAMTQAGARAVITRRRAEESDAPGTAAPAQADTPPPQEGLSIAPAGADVLRPEERAPVPAANIDIDHLAAEEIGDRLAPPAPEVPPRPVPDYELAAVGADLVDAQPEAPVDVPTGDLFSLAPQEYDLSDCAPPVEVGPELATEHLDLAEAGSELLTEEQRRRETPPAPDTSHLQIEFIDEGS